MENINYDEVLCEESLTITIKGKKYTINSPTLSQIFAYEKSINSISKVKSIEEQIAKMKKSILAIYSDVPEDDLNEYSMEILRKMLMDIRSLMQRALFPGLSKVELDDKKKQETDINKSS